MDDRPIFLVGFMGSGKTTVGRRLAERLGWDFLDTDSLVEERAGRSTQRIFAESGEQRFREIESEVLVGLSGRTRAVVATGGGLFLQAENRRRLKQLGRTVWLDVPLETCAFRVGSAAGRPLWSPDEPLAFQAVFDRRAAAYALAEVRIRITEDSADETVGRVLGVFD